MTTSKALISLITCILLIAMGATASGCGGTTAANVPEPESAMVLHQQVLRARAALGEEPPSRLAVEIRDITGVARTVRFRGSVVNKHDQTVDGVHYRLRLFSTDGARTLRTDYEEIDSVIAPGDSQPFLIEIQSMYFATVPRFLIDAIPVRLGDDAFPPPPAWRE